MERGFKFFFKYTTKAKWLREMTVLDWIGAGRLITASVASTTLATWHMHPHSNATSSLD